MEVGILGAGNWGTTFAMLLNRIGHSVTLWEHDAAQAATIAKERQNIKFLPGYDIPCKIRVTTDIKGAIHANVLVIAVPTQVSRNVFRAITHLDKQTIVLSLVKGIEQKSLDRISQICSQELTGFDAEQFAVL